MTYTEQATENVRKQLDGMIDGIGITKIQGLLKRVLNNEIDQLKREVREHIFSETGQMTLEDCMDVVCFHYNVDPDFLMSKTRKREAVEPRQLIVWMTRNRVYPNRLSLANIARFFNQDHATAIHACKAIDNLIEMDSVFREDVMMLCNELKASTKWTGKKLIVRAQRKKNEKVSNQTQGQAEHVTS